ncbi:MAG: hypothetical protein IJ659_03595 [Alloprevotella sp.]|nr:hypothetical protein [Alloprevotella sp.]
MQRTLQLFILLAAALLLCSRPATAQDRRNPAVPELDLKVSGLYDGYYFHRKDAKEVTLWGRKLEPYKLVLFRSLTLTPTPKDVEHIERAVRHDTRYSRCKEEGLRGGHLYYGFYQIPMKSGYSAFIFYRNNALRPAAVPTLTVILMYGDATMEELREKFGNK